MKAPELPFLPLVIVAILCGTCSEAFLVPSARGQISSARNSFSPRVADTQVPPTSPLPPERFAGMVEQGINERFGSGASRIVESWRLIDAEYEHFEFVGKQQNPPVLEGETSLCHQQAHSFVPGLAARTFYDVEGIEWAQKLKAKYKDIRKEFQRVTQDMERLTQEGNNIWAGALTDDASSYGTGWRTLVLQERGTWDPINVNLFPKTAKAVRDSGAPVVEVFFASMKPQTDIKPHSDNTNFVLTSHLALDIPESGNNKCRLSVGDETRQWINGEVMLFDTSILHDAINESDKTRYILMLRVWHPDLTDTEKQALQFTYDCLQLPDLVSPNAEDRFRAEMQLEALRKFPEIKTEPAVGFGGRSGNKTKKAKKKPNKKGFGAP